MGYSYAKARLRLSQIEQEIRILKHYQNGCSSLGTALDAANKERAELQKLMPDESDEDVLALLRSWTNSTDREKARVAEYFGKLREQEARYIESLAAAHARIAKLEEQALILETAMGLAEKELDRYTSTCVNWVERAEAVLIDQDQIQKPVFEDEDVTDGRRAPRVSVAADCGSAAGSKQGPQERTAYS